MDQETFNARMDELDRKNPRPAINFYSAKRIAEIAASARASAPQPNMLSQAAAVMREQMRALKPREK